MGLSVANLSALSRGTRVLETRPQAYTVANESSVSDAFSESMNVAGGGLTPVPPVQYATAEVVAGNRTEQMDKAMQVSAAYNDIASSFSGAATTYNAASKAQSYGVAGSNIDVYA